MSKELDTFAVHLYQNYHNVTKYEQIINERLEALMGIKMSEDELKGVVYGGINFFT